MKFRVFVFLLFTTAVLGFSQQPPQESLQEFSQESLQESPQESLQESPQGDDNWFMGKPIRDIVFSGLKNISLQEIEPIMQPYKGRIFDDIIFWEIQGRLYALEYFDRIEPSTHEADAQGSEVIIRFSVVERPVISRIVFAGNSGLRNRDLLEVISSKASDILNQAKIRIDVEAITNKYIEKGYPNASVAVEENTASDGSINLVFRINEREKLAISKIEFQGNTVFSNNTLRSQLSLKAKSLINNGAFQDSKLLEDIESVGRYYHDRGYIDAVVTDVTRTLDTESKGANMVLTFKIDEGEIFTFGGITFEGNEIFSTDQLSKLVTSKTGDIVNATKLETDLQNVADLYYENGYIFNSIINTPDKNYETYVLSYKISVVERSRAYIESITVIGNVKTRTGVILREIPMEPGDVFSKTKIMNALRNLYNLQYFSAIIPDTLPGSTENTMDLVFTVEEQMTTDVQAGLTFSGTADPESFPISGLLEWTDRNLLGTGNEIGVKINSSVIDSTTASVNYQHRWIFGLPLSLGTDFTAEFVKRLATMRNQTYWFVGDEQDAFPDGFSAYEEYVSNDKLPPSEYLMKYNQWYLSLGLSTGYRWTTMMGILSVNGGIRVGIVRNSYDEIFEPFDPTLRERNNSWTPMNSFWSSVSIDQRDIYYDPSRGYYLTERLGFFGIFKNEREHYIRSDTKAQYYYTLFNIPVTQKWSFKSVLAFHLGLSVLFKQPGRNPNSLTPVIEEANKLAVDGMFNARGWNEAYRDKGLLLVDSWVELRFPVVPGILALDFFLDAAGVESKQGYYFGRDNENNRNFTINNLRFSYGGGLRIALPQFPIRVSIAKRFRFKDNEFTWVPGALFALPSRPNSGVDLVISFIMSY